MKNPYYMIWADAFWASKRKKVSVIFVFLAIGLAQYANISTILIILIKFNIKIDLTPEFTYFHNEDRNTLIEAIFFEYLPLAIINYFFVYWRGKNLKLMKKYKDRRAVLFLSYISASIFLFLLVVGFGMLFLGW